MFGFFLDEEVEGVVDGHVGDQIDFDLQLRDRLWENITGEVVAVGILLEIDEVIGRRNLQRVTDDLGLGMGRRFQSYDLR
ncbi:hypothetical protein D9M72_577140 [compost metagenome]